MKVPYKNGIKHLFELGWPYLLLLAVGINVTYWFKVADGFARAGDIQHHYFAFKLLVNQGLPNWQLKIWNPGNLFGEVLFLNYFPTPFLIQSLLTLVFSDEQAFNLGIQLVILAFPLSVYFCFRGMGYKQSGSLIGGLVAFIYFFNESHSVLGGNALSTQLGQYCQSYALVFLFIWLGLEGKRQSQLDNRFQACVLRGVLVSLIASSHTYGLLMVPLFSLSLIFRAPAKYRWQEASYFLKLGIFSFLLSSWQLIPQLMQYQFRFEARYEIEWVRNWRYFFGSSLVFVVFFFLLAIGAAIFCLFQWRKASIRSQLSKNPDFRFYLSNVWFWLFVLMLTFVLLLTAKFLGHVPERLFPFLQMALFLLSASVMALFTFDDRIRIIFLGCLIYLALVWVPEDIVTFKESNSLSKHQLADMEGYDSFWSLSEFLKSQIPRGRLIFETKRISSPGFDIDFWGYFIPSDTGQEVVRTLYIETSFLTGIAKWAECRISKQCQEYFSIDIDYPKLNLLGMAERLRTLGVRYVLVTTPEAKQAMDTSPEFAFLKSGSGWDIYSLRNEETYVEVLSSTPEIMPRSEFKVASANWFRDGKELSKPLFFLDTEREVSSIKKSTLAQDCHPQIKTSFNHIHLKTDCPGITHILKFAYHPGWSVESGEAIMPVSPGFMAITPQTTEVSLRFGNWFIWTIANWISVLSGLVGLGWTFFKRL